MPKFGILGIMMPFSAFATPSGHISSSFWPFRPLIWRPPRKLNVSKPVARISTSSCLTWSMPSNLIPLSVMRSILAVSRSTLSRARVG